MAYKRVTRLQALVRGVSTDINKPTKFSMVIALNYSFGKDGSDIGPTTADLVGLDISVSIEVADSAEIAALSNQTSEALVVHYLTQGGVARKLTIAGVKFGEIGPVTVSTRAGQQTTRFQVSGNIILATDDQSVGDVMAVADDS